MLPVRSSSDDNAICYVLPVLWLTSCFHIIVDRRQRPSTSDQSSPPAWAISTRPQLAANDLIWRRYYGAGTKSAVPDCIVFLGISAYQLSSWPNCAKNSGDLFHGSAFSRNICTQWSWTSWTDDDRCTCHNRTRSATRQTAKVSWGIC